MEQHACLARIYTALPTVTFPQVTSPKVTFPHVTSPIRQVVLHAAPKAFGRLPLVHQAEGECRVPGHVRGSFQARPKPDNALMQPRTPEIRDHQTRSPKSGIRSPKPEARSEKPETRSTDHKHETRNLKTETRNPKSETQSLRPESLEPKSRVLQSATRG